MVRTRSTKRSLTQVDEPSPKRRRTVGNTKNKNKSKNNKPKSKELTQKANIQAEKALYKTALIEENAKNKNNWFLDETLKHEIFKFVSVRDSKNCTHDDLLAAMPNRVTSGTPRAVAAAKQHWMNKCSHYAIEKNKHSNSNDSDDISKLKYVKEVLFITEDVKRKQIPKSKEKHYRNQGYAITCSVTNQSIVDADILVDVWYDCHVSKDHGGEDTLYALLKDYKIPNVKSWIKFMKSQCDGPKCAKGNQQLPPKIKAPLKPIPPPSRPFMLVHVDLFQLPESKSGNKFGALAVCALTGYTEARPIPNKDAGTVAKFLLECIYARYGLVPTRINDNGGEFVNELNEDLSSRMGTEVRCVKPRRPQGKCHLMSDHFLNNNRRTRHI